MWLKAFFSGWMALLGGWGVGAAQFRRVVVDADLPGAYSVLCVDVDGDGATDIVAQGSEIRWYRNPDWRRFPLSPPSVRGLVYMAAEDLTGDGLPEIVAAHDFSLSRTTSGGSVSWLERTDDLSRPWNAHLILSEPTAHRVFWLDSDGDGRRELLVVPIAGRGSKPPAYADSPVRILLASPPPDPREGRWLVELVDSSLHLCHTVQIVNWDEDRADEFLTASYEGVMLFDRVGGVWRKRKLGAGYQAESAPRRGVSDVVVGRQGGRRFLATIEPWHGEHVVVYRPGKPGKLWRREVIDSSLRRGHALCTGDFDGDGTDEIVAGYRGGDTGLLLFRYTASSARWRRVRLDTNVAAQGCAVVDMDADGDLDLVAVGGRTHNVVLYLNLSKRAAGGAN